MYRYVDPKANYYEPAPDVDPTVNEVAREAQVNAYWLDGLMHASAARRPFTKQSIETAILGYEDADDEWDELFSTRVREYFQDNPTCFWCSRCAHNVDLDDLVEVLAGFLEHDGHSIDPR